MIWMGEEGEAHYIFKYLVSGITSVLYMCCCVLVPTCIIRSTVRQVYMQMHRIIDHDHNLHADALNNLFKNCIFQIVELAC